MKRFICVILCVTLLLCTVVFCASADTLLSVTSPTVFISGENEYNIVWVTDCATAAFVELTADGVTYVYRDEKDGIIRTDDWIHTVRVPKDVLDRAKKYTAITREVLTNDAGGITYGTELRHESEFMPYGGQDKVTLGFFSDLHLKPAAFERLDKARVILDSYIGGADVIVLNGDITDAMPTENYFSETLLEASHRLSGGKLPVVYVRGNHEARGEFAQYLSRYLAFDTGEMYGSFSYGPISAIVADCGEDKADYRGEYGSLIDFDNYNKTQLTWLENMGGYREGARYNLGISHSPAVIDRLKDGALGAMTGHGTDVLIGGHYHTAQEYRFASFPVLTDGGLTTDGYRAARMVFENGRINFDVFDDKGEGLFSYEKDIPEKKVTGAQAKKEPDGETAGGGLISADEKGSASSASITVSPTVFDAGDSYSIVYMTDAGSNMSKGSVVVKKDGVSYTFTDAQSGNAVSNLLHSVSVPKEILNGATYTVKTTHLSGYGAYGEDIAYDGVHTDLGYTTVSQEFKFEDISTKKELCIASFSDITGGRSDAVKIKNSLTVKPDIYVLGGNMTEGIYSYKDFANNILAFSSVVSGGTRPVILCRGDGEGYGDIAPYLSEIIRVTKGGERRGVYYTTYYGDLCIIVPDTAGGRISDSYRAKQSAYLDTLKIKEGKKVFVAAADADIAKSIMGDNYKALGCAAVLGKGEGYGYITKYADGKYGSVQNTFAGCGEIKLKKIKVAPDKARTGDTLVPVTEYLTDTDKQAAIDADTENEPVTEKYEKTEWHVQVQKTWAERGLDTSNKSEPEYRDMSCAEFLVAYCNLIGVDLESLEGTNNMSKAIDFAFSQGIISYKPPMMHKFTAKEIEDILTNGDVKTASHKDD